MNCLKNKKNSSIDLIFYYLSGFSACSIIVIFLGILYCLIDGSRLALTTFGLQFFSHNTWNPVLAKFGAADAICGTLITSIIALFLAVPTSFGLTIFITYITPGFIRRYLRVAIDLLAGIPSIIYGMWGLFVLAPLIGQHLQPWLARLFGWMPLIGSYFNGSELGVGLFSAGVILGIMITPFIASIMYDVVELVPDLLQESSYALGATVWETIWYVVLPYGRTGFIAGIMLGLGRALGETMAVAFVIGNAHTITTTLFEPASSITSTLANEFTESTYQLYSSSLIALGFYLFIITAIVVFIAKKLLHFISNNEY